MSPPASADGPRDIHNSVACSTSPTTTSIATGATVAAPEQEPQALSTLLSSNSAVDRSEIDSAVQQITRLWESRRRRADARASGIVTSEPAEEPTRPIATQGSPGFLTVVPSAPIGVDKLSRHSDKTRMPPTPAARWAISTVARPMIRVIRMLKRRRLPMPKPPRPRRPSSTCEPDRENTYSLPQWQQSSLNASSCDHPVQVSGSTKSPSVDPQLPRGNRIESPSSEAVRLQWAGRDLIRCPTI